MRVREARSSPRLSVSNIEPRSGSGFNELLRPGQLFHKARATAKKKREIKETVPETGPREAMCWLGERAPRK